MPTLATRFDNSGISADKYGRSCGSCSARRFRGADPVSPLLSSFNIGEILTKAGVDNLEDLAKAIDSTEETVTTTEIPAGWFTKGKLNINVAVGPTKLAKELKDLFDKYDMNKMLTDRNKLKYVMRGVNHLKAYLRRRSNGAASLYNEAVRAILNSLTRLQSTAVGTAAGTWSMITNNPMAVTAIASILALSAILYYLNKHDKLGQVLIQMGFKKKPKVDDNNNIGYNLRSRSK